MHAVGLDATREVEPTSQVVAAKPIFIKVEVEVVKHLEVEAARLPQFSLFHRVLLLDLLGLLPLERVDLSAYSLVVGGLVVHSLWQWDLEEQVLVGGLRKGQAHLDFLGLAQLDL